MLASCITSLDQFPILLVCKATRNERIVAIVVVVVEVAIIVLIEVAVAAVVNDN